MKATKQIWPEEANNFETSEILLMFSALSSGEKPKPLLSPPLMISPSRMNTFVLSSSIPSNLALIASDKVDLPAPEKPVNQNVAPLTSVNLFES